MKKLLVFVLMLIGSLSLMACVVETDGEDPDLAKVEEAAGRLDALFPTRGETVRNLTLPTTMIHGVGVTWESSDPSVIDPTTGQVSRPEPGEPNVTVTLTATFTLNEASKVRSLNFVVIAMPETDSYTDFAELHAEAAVNDFIAAEGIIVSIFRAGYFIYDGVNYISVYKPNHDVVSMGDRVVVFGQYGRYHTLFQITNVTDEVVLSSGNDTTVPVEEKTVAEINALDSDADRLINGRTYRTQGVLELRGTHNNVNIVDGEESLLVYFMSSTASIESLEQFIGQMVEVEVIYYTNHSADGVMVVFQGGVDDITIVELDDQESFDLDVAAVQATPDYTFEDDITLPAIGANGTEFTNWTSSHPDYIANDGTFVAMPAEYTVVTFTGTATLGSLTEEVTVTVQALATMAIDDAIDVELDNHVMIEGVISLFVPSNSGFFVYDGTGYMYVRDTALFSSIEDDYNVGDNIKIVGARANYRGIYQLTALKLIEASTETFDMPVNEGEATVADIGAGVYPAGTTVTVTGLVSVIVGNFTDYRIYDGEDFIQIHHNSNNTLFGDFDGMMVTVEVTVFQWDHSSPFVTYFGTVEEIELADMSDEDKVSAALVELDLGDTTMVMDDLVLPLEGAHDTTISWSSDNLDALANDGTVTRGAEDVTVTLTATITSGDVSNTKDFTIVIMNQEFTTDGMSVADVLQEDIGTRLNVEGVVTGYPVFSGNTGFFIQDADGTAIFIAEDIDGIEVGNKVTIRGDLALFTANDNDRPQLVNVLLIDNDGGEHPIFVFDDQTLEEIADNWPANQSMRFYVENAVITDIAHNSFFFAGNDDMDFRFDFRNYGQEYVGIWEVGDTVAWMEFNIYDLNWGDIRVEYVFLPELEEDEEEPSDWDYTQSFDDVGEASSYSTVVEFTDTHGFDWDILGRPDNDSIILGNANDGSFIEVTVQGGVSAIEIDAVRAFGNSNTRSFEVFVNGVSVGEFTVDPEGDTPQIFLIEDIDVAGEVVIRIETTSPGSRGAFNINQISWNTYEE